jgi:hypothetical protein
MPSTYTPITTATASGSSGTITFSSIPQTYTDLVLVIQCGYTSGSNYAIVRANGDSEANSNYGNTYVLGDGSTASSGGNGGLSGFYSSFGTVGNTTLNFMSTMQIFNYSNTTTFKTSLTRANLASSGTETIVACRRTNTNAITSLEIKATSSSIFATGSTFSLYGIKAA